MTPSTGAIFTSGSPVDGERAEGAPGKMDGRWPLWQSAVLVVVASGALWAALITALLLVL